MQRKTGAVRAIIDFSARATRDRLLCGQCGQHLLPKPEDGAGLRHGQEQDALNHCCCWDSAPRKELAQAYEISAQGYGKCCRGECEQNYCFT